MLASERPTATDESDQQHSGEAGRRNNADPTSVGCQRNPPSKGLISLSSTSSRPRQRLTKSCGHFSCRCSACAKVTAFLLRRGTRDGHQSADGGTAADLWFSRG